MRSRPPFGFFKLLTQIGEYQCEQFFFYVGGFNEILLRRTYFRHFTKLLLSSENVLLIALTLTSDITSQHIKLRGITFGCILYFVSISSF